MPAQRDYQRQGSLFLLDRERAILADEPGLGKTNQLLTAAVGKTLILSPAMLSEVWKDEREAWHPDLDSVWVSYGSVCRRVTEVNKAGKKVSKVVVAPREYLDQHWDTIICDEAHHLKGRTTSWTKVVHGLSKQSDRLYLATGTPLPNWGHEVFMSLRLLYPDDRRFTNYWAWVNEYFRTSKPRYGGTKIGDPHIVRRHMTDDQRAEAWSELAIEWGLSDRWLRRTQEEVLGELPPMTHQVMRVPMVPKQRRFYDALKKEMFAKLPETGDDIIAWNEDGVWGKLLQASTGLSTLRPGEGHGGKMAVLADLVRDRPRPVIVFAAYHMTCEAISEMLRSAGIHHGVVHSKIPLAERQSTLATFQAGDMPVLVGTVGVLAEGLTLTVADTVIFMERSPRAARNAQAEKRIHRFGQDKPTTRIDLITEDSVDETLYKLIRAKDRQSGDAIRGADLAAGLLA